MATDKKDEVARRTGRLLGNIDPRTDARRHPAGGPAGEADKETGECPAVPSTIGPGIPVRATSPKGGAVGVALESWQILHLPAMALTRPHVRLG